MKKNIQRLLPLLLLTVLLTNCKKNFDTYYERPATLEPPIYQILTEKGNFKSLLALIDKGGYKQTLSTAGYWTLFAPNDEAFTAYFTANSTSVEKMDSAAAQSMVQYLLVYNAFNKDRIDDYQSDKGWVVDDAFRRRTAYYTGFYLSSKKDSLFLASNRNGGYLSSDNNNKYITYFTDAYMNAKKLTATDYNFFYPNSTFSGFNVAEAKVVNKDIAAENGVIHELDKVVSPLPSLDEYLADKPDYSLFKSLYDRYMISYIKNADASRRYQLLTGIIRDAFIKTYNGALAYSPNNENFQKLQDNDGQQNCWTLFVPKNEPLLAYLRNVILEEYGRDTSKLKLLPAQVVTDLLNAHMWQAPVWPSKFSSTLNTLGDEARFNTTTDIAEKKILSNGIFYGTNKVEDASVFSTVYARAYLNPNYTIMTKLLSYELKNYISRPEQKYTVFMMSDQVLAAAGFSYTASPEVWSWTPPGGSVTSGEAVRQRLLRILATSIVPTPNGQLNTITGPGIIEAYNGEFLRYDLVNGAGGKKDTVIISGGTQDAKVTVKVDSSKVSRNGKVYYINGLLTYSEIGMGYHIQRLVSNTGAAVPAADSAKSPFYNFYRYLENSAAYDIATGSISGTSAGSFYTVFVPNNASIVQAVKDGLLPGNVTTGVPNFAPTAAPDKLLVSQFIQYHILDKRSLVADGKDAGGYDVPTILKNAIGDPINMKVVENIAGVSLKVSDTRDPADGRRTGSVIMANSNNLSNRTIIHLLDNYLKVPSVK